MMKESGNSSCVTFSYSGGMEHPSVTRSLREGYSYTNNLAQCSCGHTATEFESLSERVFCRSCAVEYARDLLLEKLERMNEEEVLELAGIGHLE